MGKKETNEANDVLEKSLRELEQIGQDESSGNVMTDFAKSVRSLLENVMAINKSKTADGEAVVNNEDKKPGDKEDQTAEDAEGAGEAEDVENDEEDLEDEDEIEGTEKSSAGLENEFYKSLSERSEFVEVVEVATELEHLTNVLGKGLGSLEDNDIATNQKLDLLAKGFSGVAVGLTAMAKSLQDINNKVEAIAATSSTPTGLVGVVGADKRVAIVDSEGKTPAEFSKSQVTVKLMDLLRKGEIQSNVLRTFDTQGLEGLSEEILTKLGLQKAQ